ncbi:MAG: DivIVA domain-containing protein [Solirubrobacterales bacterium]|nr:DivIVA domain-containing protein [Solirubrobacterales bacterium]
MALDRASIERRDFPTALRGYDRDAVDAHLAALAAEVEALGQSSGRRPDSLAAAAGEQVRSLVEAAESSAAAMMRQAEAEAADIRLGARGEARAARQEAASEARGYIGTVSQSTAAMLQRLEAMQNELNALFDALRAGSTRLSADLRRLGTGAGDLRAAVAAPSESEASVPAVDGQPAPLRPTELPAPAVAVDAPAPAADAPGPNLVGEPAGEAEDAEGARLVALNMALDGTPREETERYLDAHFKLADRRRLLDDVYAAADG